jgi:putative peptide zinc metalloprotease protein
MIRCRVAVLVVVATMGLLGAPGAVGADTAAGGANNVVLVTNKSDNAVAARGRATVSLDPGPTVGNQNLAVARASCTGCRTVAAAVQVVVVEGDVTDFQPVNAALAVNSTCQSCDTFAYANQVVLSPGRPVHMSDDAEESIAQVNRAMGAVVRSPESFTAMTTDLDNLTQTLVGIVQAEIARAGSEAGERHFRQVEHPAG